MFDRGGERETKEQRFVVARVWSSRTSRRNSVLLSNGDNIFGSSGLDLQFEREPRAIRIVDGIVEQLSRVYNA